MKPLAFIITLCGILCWVPGRAQHADSSQYYLTLGDSLYFSNDFTGAAKAMQKSIEHLTDDPVLQVKVHNSMANVMSGQGQRDLALKHYLIALKEAAKITDKPRFEATLCQNISALYQEMGDFPKAFEYLNRAEKIGQTLNDTLFNADLYNNKGLLMELVDSLPAAVESYLKAYELFEKIQNDERMSLCANNLGVVYKNLGEYDKAIYYYDLSLEKAKALDHEFLIAANYINLGNLYTRIKKFPSAKTHYDEGLRIARAIAQPDLIKECLSGLAEYYEALGDYKSALDYQKRYQAISDTILNKQKIEAIADLETRFEVEKKELQLESLAKENQKKKLYIILLGLVLILLIGGIAVGVRINNLRKRKRELELIALTEKQERDRIAQDLHDELGSGISRINWITSGAKMSSKSDEDIQRYTHIEDIATQLSVSMKSLIWLLYSGNCTLEALAGRIREMAAQHADDFGYDLQFDIDGDNGVTLQQNAARDLFLMIKECVNNASKHAQAKQLSIRCELNNDTLKWTVRDDGKGFDANHPSNGHGLHNLRKRISVWQGAVAVSSQPGHGTTIHITVPVKNVMTESSVNASV